MVNLGKVSKDLEIICKGWKLLSTQVIEIQFKDFEEKNVMLTAAKLNFPQNLTIKVDIQLGNIKEIYPSELTTIYSNSKAVPYYSISVEYKNNVPILNKTPSDFYYINDQTIFDQFFIEKGITDFTIIQRNDIIKNQLNKWYVKLPLQDIKKVCNKQTTDFINQLEPNMIFIYSEKTFNDKNTFLLSFIPMHELYQKYFNRFFVTQDN
jgi:hypothetical protein